MKVLFDHGTPAPLRRALADHDVRTAHEMGWAELSNGELLKVAAAEFDVLVTTDKNLSYQQDVARYRLAILVLPTTSWPKLRQHEARVAAAVASLRPGQFVTLEL